jgi:SAM-dependent methyltransferase
MKFKDIKNYALKDVIRAIIDRLIIGSKRMNYRQALFKELLSYSNDTKGYKRILEIGPKDGEDTKRLLTLEPEELFLIDLPHMEEVNQQWISGLESSYIRYFSGNIMYDHFFEDEHFNMIWCTGVLYHNPEQLRMIRLLYDLLKPEGILVIESASTRARSLRKKKVVQVLYPF